ncbi:MAG: uroporphyrinogen-III C-methyltransferase [Lysobacterales bacterium]|jgi:uroporphyrin-3 C-methyltransferase
MDSKQLSEDMHGKPADPVDRLLQERKPEKSGNAIAVLALLVALAAVVVSGWLWWQQQTATPEQGARAQALVDLQAAQQDLAQSVTALQSELESLAPPLDVAEFSRQGARLGALEDRLATLQDRAAEDEASIGAVQGGLRSLEQRLSATESGLLSVAAASQNSSVELDIAEIDYLLRVANERLQLFADVEAADLALQAADVQTESLSDPMFLGVRQRIAEARQALAQVPYIDVIDISARLGAMQKQVPELPFSDEEARQPEPEVAEEDTGWWASLKSMLSSLVTVRRRVPEEPAMLSLEDKDYLRQGLWLQLESARLALMRHDASIYVGSLDRVGTTVEQFFNVGAPSVQALLHETADLKGINVEPDLPDISAPWAQLRQIRDSRRLLQTVTPIEGGDGVE